MISSSSLVLGLVALPLVLSKTINVAVGKGGLVFDPPALSADIGDNVVFTFFAKNHSVTQTSFGAVCSKKDGGLDSGFQPVPANSTAKESLPTFTVPVTTKDPLWFFCAQASGLPASHCGQGMVFSINCPFEGPNSFDNFKKSALEIGKNLASGSGPATGVTTAAYGGYTIPAAPEVVVVTQPITVGTASWTTTYSSYPGSPAPTPVSIEGKVHKVIVGGSSGLVFDPPHLDAAPRDVVQFEFHQKNHSVVQSTFADPCRKMDGGFASGLQPVADSLTSDFPTFSITINGTEPIWAYCSQKTPVSHCGSGMVFAVNPVESSARNFSAFQDLAKVMNGTAAAASSPQPTNGAVVPSLPLSSVLAVLGAVAFGLTL